MVFEINFDLKEAKFQVLEEYLKFPKSTTKKRSNREEVEMDCHCESSDDTVMHYVITVKLRFGAVSAIDLEGVSMGQSPGKRRIGTAKD